MNSEVVEGGGKTQAVCGPKAACDKCIYRPSELDGFGCGSSRARGGRK